MSRVFWIMVAMLYGGMALGGVGIVVGLACGLLISADIGAGHNYDSNHTEPDFEKPHNDMFDMTDDFHQGVNPGSGMPMIHKNSGVDVGGNPRGQNLHDLMD